MKNWEIILGGGVATSISATGTATQSDSVLQIISLIVTILGAFISMILIPILNWYKEAKKDGKISAEEIKEGIDTLANGSKGVIDTIKNNTKKGE